MNSFAAIDLGRLPPPQIVGGLHLTERHAS